MFTEVKLFELVNQLLSIDEIDFGRAVTRRLTHSFSCEIACRDNQSFVSTPNHRATKVTHYACAY